MLPIDHNRFMILVKHTPYHFKYKSNIFDYSHAVNLSLKSIYAFGRVYSLVDARTKAERERMRETITAINKIPYDVMQGETIKSICNNINAIQFLRNFERAEYCYENINILLPFICHTQKIIVNVKVTKNASQHSFEKEIINHKYYAELALMRLAVEKNYDCYILAIEIDDPHAYAFYQISEDLLSLGRDEISNALNIYKECQENNYYPTYANGAATLIEKPNYL